MMRASPPPVLARPLWTGGTSLRSSRTVQFAVLAIGLAILRLTNPDHPLPIDLCAFKA